MRAAVSSLSEWRDGWRQKVGPVGNGNAHCGDMPALVSFLHRFQGKNERVFMLQLLPLKPGILAVDAESFRVRPGGLEPGACHFCRNFYPRELEDGGLERECVRVRLLDVRTEAAGAEAADAGRLRLRERQEWGHRVRGVVLGGTERQATG